MSGHGWLLVACVSPLLAITPGVVAASQHRPPAHVEKWTPPPCDLWCREYLSQFGR